MPASNWQGSYEHSACLACYRKWLPPPAEAAEAPLLVEAFHNVNDGINFDTAHDEYLSIWFDTPRAKITLDDVEPEVSGYGVRPIHVARREGNRWQANFKLPPGLTAGWHEVTVRFSDSRQSNALRIAVDVPLPEEPIGLAGVSDGTTWAANQLDLGQGRALSLWLTGLPANADRNNVRVFLNGRRLNVAWIGPPRQNERRQVNVDVPADIGRGPAQIGAAVGGQRTAPAAVEIL